MMPGQEASPQARSDDQDSFVFAEEPLLGLQLRCGGTVPGAIAIPALRELVVKARHLGLRLARPILAQDGENAIRAWVEVAPAGGDGGCAIALRNWHSSPLPPEDAEAALARRARIDAALAELTARLDAGQALLAVEAEAPDLLSALAAMRAGLGRPWTDFVMLEGNLHRQPLHWRLLNGVHLRVEGSDRRWRAALIPQAGANGEPGGFELHLIADRPLAPPEEQEALPAAMDGSAGLVGRELAPILRQPIARIIATSETIGARLAGPLADNYVEYAGYIAASGQHLLGLVEDLADLEVIEAADFAPARDAIDLAEVARRAAGILGVRAREKGIVLAAPDASARVPALAEFRRVLQIVLNLAGNAIRYSPQAARVEIGVEASGGRARVVVTDNGPGIAPGDQARVFDKFERLGRGGDGGSGLGLYISRRLARAMSGDLSVTSVPGEGSRFILDLPAA